MTTQTEIGPRRDVEVHLNGRMLGAMLAEDVRRGLTSDPKYLPPRYFYDTAGSALFEQITRLPEYYLTRVERQIIASNADELMDLVRPYEIVELGSGSPSKIRRLLDSNGHAPHVERYVPVDLDEGGVRSTARAVGQSYPWIDVSGIVGDFERHLGRVPSHIGRRLVAFFGSTIGNLDPAERREFLRGVRGLLEPGDRFLLGVDLVKEVGVMEAAYNDGARVTEEFNRNILRVVNRGVDADFLPEAFQHKAFYNASASRIEMHLVPESLQTVRLRDLGLTIQVSPGESIWTESSYKFTRESATSLLRDVDLHLERWYTDDEGMFALALAAAR